MSDEEITLENEKRELMRLLNISSDIDIKKDHPLTTQIQSLYQFQHNGDFRSRNLQLWSIQFLIQQLRDIERYDTKLLEDFGKKLKTVGYGEYFGVRMEINIATALFKNNIKFKKRESPDFEISFNSDIVFIECTSSHITFTNHTERVIQNKIHSSIRKKTKKSYCNDKTALFIDVTNLAYTGYSKILDKSEMKKYLQKILSHTKYGAIVLFTFISNYDLNRYESSYVRIDNKITNEILFDFLNQQYPLGDNSVTKAGILSQG